MKLTDGNNLWSDILFKTLLHLSIFIVEEKVAKKFRKQRKVVLCMLSDPSLAGILSLAKVVDGMKCDIIAHMIFCTTLANDEKVGKN